MEKDSFTAREVGVLIEDLKSEFKYVLEVVTPLPERLSAVEERLEKVEIRLTGVEDAVRIAIPDLTKRVTRLESKVGI